MEQFKIKAPNNVHICDQLAKVEYEQYGKGLKAAILLAGIGIVILGIVYPFGRMWKGIFIVLGMWLAVSYNFPFVVISERRAAEHNFGFPAMEYEFDEEGITQRVDGAEFDLLIPYNEVVRLLEDDLCFYFFLSDKRGHVIMKDSFAPAQYSEFLNWLTERTGLIVRRRKTAGLRRAALRLRERVEEIMLKAGLFREKIDRCRQKRDEREKILLKKEEEKKKASALAVEQREKALRREQEWHEELAADPEKMEAFKASVKK